MGSFTAFLLITLAMVFTCIATTGIVVRLVLTGKESKSRVVQLFAEQIHRDLGGDPETEQPQSVEKLYDAVVKLTEVIMDDRAQRREQQPWEGRLPPGPGG